MPYWGSGQSGSGIPSGVIVMWSGSVASIPSGWFLCNGSNGTPNLRDKFIVCASGDYGGVAVTGISGGPTRYGGKNKHMHTLSFSGGGSTSSPVSGSIDVQSGTGATVAGSSHNHTFSFSGDVATQYPSEHENSSALPPYFALAYIMKG